MTDGVSSGSPARPADERDVPRRRAAVLVEDERVRGHLAASLSDVCEVATPTPASVDRDEPPMADLLVVDRATLADGEGTIEPVGSPVLLVTPDGADPGDGAWTVADDVVSADASARLVRRRAENLFERSPWRDSERELPEVLERVSDCTVAVDLDPAEPTIRAANRAFRREFGYDERAIRGASLYDLIVPDDDRDRARTHLRQADRGEVVTATVRRDTAFGRREFALRLVSATDRRGEAYALYRDLSEERCRKQQVEVLNRVLRHNLRNDLNVILGNAELLVDAADAPPASEAARSIRAAARELVELGETAGSLQARWNPGDEAVDAVTTVDRIREEIVDARDARIRVDAPEAAPVIADGRLEVVFRELCENAVEYGDGSGEPVRVEIVRRDGWTDVRFLDSGPGLPDAERAVLRGDDETPLRHGSGLGLWIVNWIVTALGGEVSVADREPSGTAVTVSFRSADRRSSESGR